MAQSKHDLRESSMAERATPVENPRSYPASWIDRFNHWLAGAPIQAWVFFLVSGLALAGGQLLVLWLEGGLQAVEILPVILFNSFFTPFLLGLIYLLDSQAVAALNTMQPVLEMTAEAFDRYRYRLAHMPVARPLGAGLAVLVMVILMENLWTVPFRYAALEQLPIFNVVFQITDKSSAFLFGVFIYHTIRQLRLVNEINDRHIRVDLYNLTPLKAFSRLTASTAAGLVVGVYGWMLINPELLADPLVIAFAAVITLLAVTVFVWPLYGVHRQMETAKEQALQAIDQRAKAVYAKFNQEFDRDNYASLEMLNGTIASLESQQRRVSALPTWPWRPETAQFALTAIGLPLVLAILRFLAEQVLGW
jgi:hypothetical protein